LEHLSVYSSIVLNIHAHQHKFENVGHKAKICYEHSIHQHSHTPTHKTKGKKYSFSSKLISKSNQHAFYPLLIEVFFIISHILFLSTCETLPSSSSKWHYPPPPASFPKQTNITISHSNFTIGQPSYNLFSPYKQGVLYTMALPL
jgi:hypothetical protein